METVFLIIEILLFVGIFFTGVGVGLCSYLSPLLFLGLGLFGVAVYLWLLILKRQHAQKDSAQTDCSEQDPAGPETP